MADLVGGAAVGVALEDLLTRINDGTVKIWKFKKILRNIRSTLKQIRPRIIDIEKLNRMLDTSPEETAMFTERLNRCLDLIHKCEKIRWWNFWKKRLYAEKLLDMEKSLAKFCKIQLKFMEYRDSKKILVKVNQVDEKLGGNCDWNRFVGFCGVPEVPEFVVGFDEPLRELKMMLLMREERVVVLSAPGGCGKTTLAKMVCHDEEIKGTFKENIFFVTFSKIPNVRVMIEKLFQHRRNPMPNFQTAEEAFNGLELMFKQMGPNPILLVLDDVWSGSEYLVEKFKFQIPKYKILVTSRSIFPRFFTYNLKLLNDQEAMVLFRHSAFPQHRTSSIPDDLVVLVNKVVKCCGKFPLALEVVGRSLDGKPEVIWKCWLRQWSERRSNINLSQDLLICLRCLQTSFDALDEMNSIKNCFLDLASFPEDKRIPVTALIDMWIELYNLDECGDDAIANLYELANRNLINLVPTRKGLSKINGFYSEQFVMQHDLLRELAIYQNDQNLREQRSRLILDLRGNDLPTWCIEQSQHPFQARLLSITTDEIFSSNCYSIQLPMLEVLVLNTQASKYTLPKFLEKMDLLKVLIITNYGFCSTEISNFSLFAHLSSLKRIRLEHISISNLHKSMLQLKNLHKISFVVCKIDKAFQNCTVQIPDMLPNLAEIVFDYCSDLERFPVWLCNISSLQKLQITNCHELTVIPEEFGKLKILEALDLHSCTKLLKLPESIGSLQKLRHLDLTDCISINKLPGQIGMLGGLEKLHMRGCWGLSELPSSVKDLNQLKDLVCDEETAELWKYYEIHLPNLKLNLLKEEPSLDCLLDMQP